jgi:hypothetical protein
VEHDETVLVTHSQRFVGAAPTPFLVASSRLDGGEVDEEGSEVLGVAEDASQGERLVPVGGGLDPSAGLDFELGQGLELREQPPRPVLPGGSDGPGRDVQALRYPFEQLKGVGGEVELQAARSTPAEQGVDSPLETGSGLVDLPGHQQDPPEDEVGVGVQRTAVLGDQAPNAARHHERCG